MDMKAISLGENVGWRQSHRRGSGAIFCILQVCQDIAGKEEGVNVECCPETLEDGRVKVLNDDNPPFSWWDRCDKQRQVGVLDPAT